MNDDPLFQPFELRGLTLPGRTVMTAVKLGYATERGEVTDRHVAFYARRAEAGVPLLTSEPLYIRADGRELETQLSIAGDDVVDGLKRLTAAVRDRGGKIAAQLNHAGRAADPRLVRSGAPLSASAVLCPASGTVPRPATEEQIGGLVSAFAAGARRAREAGFDALELQFGHGYLIHQFLSPHTNLREDGYGGSFEARLRFGRELLAAVRAEAGDELPIVIRINATDYVEGGLTEDDAVEIARALKQAGADALSVSSGTMCESPQYCLYPAGTPQANLLPAAARIRQAVGLPVIVAGRIRTPAVARAALEAGQADLIGLARPFLADPDWLSKAAAGREASILLCAGCHQGCLGELQRGHGTSCMFHPQTGREISAPLDPAPESLRVVVVGGGPAGMEVARVAALRGHRVRLCEQSGRLGGQLALAARPPFKEGFGDAVRGMEQRVRQAGVEVHLDTRVTAEMIETARPDRVVLATGSVPLTLYFPGLEETDWLLASEVLDGSGEVTSESVFVIGGGWLGLETADFLAARGKRVCVIEMLDQVGRGMEPLARALVYERLRQRGAEIHGATRVTRLEPGFAVTHCGDEEARHAVETVVIAVGASPDRVLRRALAESDLRIDVIGDAKEPRRALEAICEGFELGRTI